MGAGFFALLGSTFGLVTALVNHFDGRAGGSFLGHAVATRFEPLSPARRAGLVGAIDGLVFGAVLGTLLSLGLAWEGEHEWVRLRQTFLAGLALVGMALLFGLMATKLAPQQRTAVACLSLGGFVGMVGGFFVAGADGLIFGAWGGLVVGSVVGVWWNRH